MRVTRRRTTDLEAKLLPNFSIFESHTDPQFRFENNKKYKEHVEISPLNLFKSRALRFYNTLYDSSENN